MTRFSSNAGLAPRRRPRDLALAACATTIHKLPGVRVVLVSDRAAMARALAGDSPVLLLRDGAPEVRPGRAADLLEMFDAVLGATLDGGWWAFGVRRPAEAAALPAMPTDWRDAGALSLAALRLGLRVAMLPTAREQVAA